MKIHSFSNSNNIGKLGEAVLHQVLKKAKIGKIKDVTNDKTYQKKGIDFIIEKGNIGIDAKLDIQTNNTGNIAIEKISKRQNGEVIKEGWAYTSEAHLIAYIYMDTSSFEWVIIFFTPEEARDLIVQYEGKPYAVKESFNYGYESVIVRVPVAEVSFPMIRVPIIGKFEVVGIKEFILH